MNIIMRIRYMFDEVDSQQVKDNQVSLQSIRNGSFQFYQAKWSFRQQDHQF